MRTPGVDLGTMVRGFLSRAVQIAIWVGFASAEAGPLDFVPTQTSPDPLPPTHAPQLAFRSSADLDGTYLWLGPSGAAGWIDSQWDSAFGVDVSVVRVREHEVVSAIGGSVGASRWTTRGGGRVWADLLVGSPLLDHTIGISAGPLLELSDASHPRVGGSIGIWGFFGLTPFARIGTVDTLGTFVEVGVHIALPAIRR
jgi:hypothetical protein